MKMTRDDFQQLMQHIGDATHLTKLKMSISSIVTAVAEEGGSSEYAANLEVCQHLGALQKRKTLTLCLGRHSQFAEQDAKHLLASVTLTRLNICRDGPGPRPDGSTLCVLAQNLTNLQTLRVNAGSYPGRDQVCTMPALSQIGRLTTLRRLSLGPLAKTDAVRGLQMLTGLNRLTSLHARHGLEHCFKREKAGVLYYCKREKAGVRALKAFWRQIKAYGHNASDTDSALSSSDSGGLSGI